MRKGENACNKQFLLFSQCFLPYMAYIFYFKCALKCCVQFVSIWTDTLKGFIPQSLSLPKDKKSRLVQNS